MGTQGAGRKRLPNRERLTAEDDALNQIAREAEARLAAKRAARAEAREIRMKELERQQKEIYQVQKKYYGLDTKWGDIEQWMEDSERYSRRARRNASASDEDERMSVGSRGSLRSHLEYASAYPVAGLENERTKRKSYSKATNGYEEDVYGSSQSRKSSRASYYSDLGLHNSGYASTSQPSSQNGNWASGYDESVYSGSRRCSASSSRAPSEYSCYLGSGSRASSRASSARASPVIEERPEKDFEKGVRTASSLSAATLASLGGTSSRRGSGDTSISADTEASIREIKDIYELKDQIQDVEGKYMQGLKELKDSLAEVEEKYKKAMVSNAQLDNEKTNFMYQVDTLKDALLELEEQLAESRRQYEEKSKEFEREKHAHSILQFQFKEMKEALKQREEMLAEIQQLQQKQQSYVREISDLQETIEWKDKKIGALERQKDFFDSIRSERDDLRDEVVVLKEQLKKHGIIPDSEVATNGETSDILDNEGHLDSSKTVQGTARALKTTGDGTLGKANEVDMKNEILEDVGKREILQNTVQEEHKEESEEQERKTLHADENAKAEKNIEENDAMPTVMLTNGRLTEQIQSDPEHVSGNVSSNNDSDADDLGRETESTGISIEYQQPVSKEAEHSDLNQRINQNSDVGLLQGQVFETPQEMPSDLGTDHKLEKAAAEQKGEDLKASDVVGGSEMYQKVDTRSSSSELVSDQSGPPEVAVAGSFSEEPSTESHTERLQHSEESTEEKVVNVLERELVGGEECTDRRIDERGSGGAEEENEIGSAVQDQTRKTDSADMEGKESRESGAPAAVSEKEDGVAQTQIQPISSEAGHTVSLEEQKMQDRTEREEVMTEKDRPKEVLMDILEACSDSAGRGKRENASAESVDCIAEGEGSVLQHAEPGKDIMKETVSQESRSDPGLSDCNVQEAEVEIQDESRKRKESKTEWVEDLKPNIEIQTTQCSQETSDTVGEKNISIEAEVQKGVKQEDAESRQESTEGLSVTAENEVDEEALKETEKQLELTDHHCDGFASEADADNSLQETTKPSEHFVQGNTESKEQNPELENVCECTKKDKDKNQKVQGIEEDKNQGIEEQGEAKEALAEEKVDSLAQKAELGANVSEQVKLESQAEEGVKNDGDAFDFEEPKQILETDEKCDGERADIQKGEAHGVIGEVAPNEETGEGRGNVETEDDSLQHEKESEMEETRYLQGKTSSQKTEEKADALEDRSKASDSNNLKKMPDENVLEEDLESTGNNREESKEDLQSGRRGKGKSKEDCTIS
ncbi:leucine-rich repeat flightless-interacting protein 1 isoform X3 [Rhea pennata]|uniref:leucine-rich repeat flightless-interacting protein 1 isoform X3 n=1 Tax=Rhea pennata TaxID=8795 RepID=UPI002E2532FC